MYQNPNNDAWNPNGGSQMPISWDDKPRAPIQEFQEPMYQAPLPVMKPKDWDHQVAYQPPVKRKRRVFLWVFLGIQAIFLIWLITGIAGTSHTGADAHTQALQFCSTPSNWKYLYGSQADCVTHYGNALNGASDVGKSVGAILIVGVWVVVDFFVGLGYFIYRLTSRR